MASNQLLDRHQSMYLNPDGADIWFIFASSQLPAHKCKLKVMESWLKSMPPPVNDRVDLTNSTISQSAFEEFLLFAYIRRANLTFTNIEAVMNLAKQSKSTEFLAECENFLLKNVTNTTLCLAYQLAFTHGVKRLKAVCEDELYAFARDLFNSPTFLTSEHAFVLNILRRNSFVLDETQIFSRCIAWAKADCERNQLNPSDSKNLRVQLAEAFYQIRFSAMSMRDFAWCTRPYPDLFTDDELHEIVCMIGQRNGYKPKRFNWSRRCYSGNHDNRLPLICERYTEQIKQYLIRQEETTTFTCNRRVLLQVLTCEISNGIGEAFTQQINLSICEKRCDDSAGNVHSYQLKNIPFELSANTESCEATFGITNGVLLRPGITYSIVVTLPQYNQLESPSSNLKLKTKVRVDHDIVFKFSERGIIKSFKLLRIDNRSYFRKILYNPKTWVWLLVLCIGLCALGFAITIIIQHIDEILDFLGKLLQVILVIIIIIIISKYKK